MFLLNVGIPDVHHHTVLCGAEDGTQHCGVLGEHLLTDHPLAPKREISVLDKGYRLEATGLLEFQVGA